MIIFENLTRGTVLSVLDSRKNGKLLTCKTQLRQAVISHPLEGPKSLELNGFALVSDMCATASFSYE